MLYGNQWFCSNIADITVSLDLIFTPFFCKIQYCKNTLKAALFVPSNWTYGWMKCSTQTDKTPGVNVLVRVDNISIERWSGEAQWLTVPLLPLLHCHHCQCILVSLLLLPPGHCEAFDKANHMKRAIISHSSHNHHLREGFRVWKCSTWYRFFDTPNEISPPKGAYLVPYYFWYVIISCIHC